MKRVNGLDYSFIKVLSICVIPFIIIDLIKVIVSVFIMLSLRKTLNIGNLNKESTKPNNRRTLMRRKK